MAQDWGILITQPGTDASQRPSINETTLNTTYAQIKIDTTNEVSFQTLTLLITTDPPEPTPPGHRYTILYKYEHGYDYKPAIETLFYALTAPPATAYTVPYYLDSIIVASKTIADYAVLYAVADDTWIYYIMDKWIDGGGSTNLLTGASFDITTHCFLDGVGV